MPKIDIVKFVKTLLNFVVRWKNKFISVIAASQALIKVV